MAPQPGDKRLPCPLGLAGHRQSRVSPGQPMAAGRACWWVALTPGAAGEPWQVSTQKISAAPAPLPGTIRAKGTKLVSKKKKKGVVCVSLTAACWGKGCPEELVQLLSAASHQVPPC